MGLTRSKIKRKGTRANQAKYEWLDSGKLAASMKPLRIAVQMANIAFKNFFPEKGIIFSSRERLNDKASH